MPLVVNALGGITLGLSGSTNINFVLGSTDPNNLSATTLSTLFSDSYVFNIFCKDISTSFAFNISFVFLLVPSGFVRSASNKSLCCCIRSLYS